MWTAIRPRRSARRAWTFTRCLSIDAALANNDAYPLLKAMDALIMTGPTGTNVNDVSVLLMR